MTRNTNSSLLQIKDMIDAWQREEFKIIVKNCLVLNPLEFEKTLLTVLG